MIPRSDIELKNFIKTAASNLGFEYSIFTNFQKPEYADYLHSWLNNNYNADMVWMNKDPQRRANPSQIWSEAKSIITLGMNYYQPWPENLNPDPSRGLIARYAWGKDYHDLLPQRLKILVKTIEYFIDSEVNARIYVDTGPILEKMVAASVNAGFIGKNSLLIRPPYGSYLFLAELLLDIKIEADDLADNNLFKCGECELCSQNCPTGALVAPHVLDSRLCISYLTIEHRGFIPRELRGKMGNNIFGCDSCQNCCPYNARKNPVTREEWFLQPDPERIAPDLIRIMSMSETEFREFFAGSAVKRCKRKGLLRNTAIALGNWGDARAVDVLIKSLDDEEELIRGHAVWALGKIGGNKAFQAIEKLKTYEQSAQVQDEIEWALSLK